MNATTALLLIALGTFGATDAAQPSRVSPPWSRQSGVIEEVISHSEGAYHSTAYVVTWNGARVLVADPLDVRGMSAGDSLDYLVTRHSTPDGRHLLAFTSLEGGTGPTTPVSIPAGDFTAMISGSIEEVLRDNDAGFRFVGYIARVGNQRVAVFDPLAQTQYGVGDEIPILELRGASRAAAFVDFQVAPERRAQAATPAAQNAASVLDSGPVEQVLSATSQGYANRAYVVRWHGADVLVEDAAANSDFRAGDTLQFRILRTGAADAHGAGTMRLVLPIPDGPAEEREPTQTSAVTQSAAVERVLRWEDGNDRGIAYLVRWHDVPVAVMDELATTSFAPGERIEFSVVQADDASGKHLDFMMFAFPRTSPASRP